MGSSLAEIIIEAFNELGGQRNKSEIEDWIRLHYGNKWSSSSISTSLADMVPKNAGGNPSSLVPEEKRVLHRVSRGVYELLSYELKQTRTNIVSPKIMKDFQINPMQPTPKLDCFVSGTPSPFANSGELEWKNQLRSQIPVPSGSGQEKGLILYFGYNGAGDIDNLCDPVFSVLINEKRWFRGTRNNLLWWIASKHTGHEGCRIQACADFSSNINDGDVVFSGDYYGSIPRRASGEEMLEWVRSRYNSNPVSSRLAVKFTFHSLNINIGEIATGAIKSCIDCLQPIFGGPVGNPDDWKLDELTVHKISKTDSSPFVRIVVYTRYS